MTPRAELQLLGAQWKGSGSPFMPEPSTGCRRSRKGMEGHATACNAVLSPPCLVHPHLGTAGARHPTADASLFPGPKETSVECFQRFSTGNRKGKQP